MAPPRSAGGCGARILGDGADLDRLQKVYEIVDDLVSGDHDMTSAVERLVVVLRLPPRWPKWLMDGGLALLTVSVSLQAGGTWRSAVGAFIVMIGVIVLGRWLTRKGIPQFFVLGSQASVAAVAGTVAIWAGILGPGAAAATVAATVVVLLPHPALVTWAQDAISGFRAMALSRALVIGLSIAGIVCGVHTGLALTTGLHLEVDPTDLSLTTLPLALSLVSTVFAAGANCFVQGARARVIPIAIAASLVAALVSFGLRELGLPTLGRTFLAAVVLGALGIGAGLVLGGLLATPGARRYLRRSKRVDVQSLHSDTTPLMIIPESMARP